MDMLKYRQLHLQHEHSQMAIFNSQHQKSSFSVICHCMLYCNIVNVNIE